jgi:hypothetical protein
MNGAVVVNGRAFTPELIARINAAVHEHPQWSRAQLSREVCEWLGWCAPNGRVQEMACRVALLRLCEQGHVQLPAARRQVRRAAGCRPAARGELGCAKLDLPSVARLNGLELVPVHEDKALAQQWKQLVEAYHYLGYRPLCGAQMRYLIVCPQGMVGALGFSAAALKVRARDRWIGWSEQARRAHLSYVVCNSRFVIVPQVRVPNLASKVLALAAQRLGADWQARYGYAPLLLETYVEARRFRGVCYRAANWQQVGMTRGRGRDDRAHARARSPKHVFVLPLCKQACERLCEAPGPARRLACRGAQPPIGDWAEEEFGQARLGDTRRSARLLFLARQFYAQPQANIAQACGSPAAAKAAYRFFEHPKLSMQDLLAPHFEATAERIGQAAYPVVLAVQDSTSFNYSAHPDMQGLGPLSTAKQAGLGIWMHETMVYDTDGVAQGLIDVQVWARKPQELGKAKRRHERAIQDKESRKWLVSFEAAARLQRQVGLGCTVISVGDREADVYELFVHAQRDAANPKLLVRAEHPRSLEDEGGPAWAYVAAQPPAGEIELALGRRKGRAPRCARLQVRFAHVSLSPPARKRALGAVQLWGVHACEPHPPSGEPPVEWMLWTSVPIDSFAQAQQALQWYARRWGIEEFHRTLKSGCRIEDRRLSSTDNWKKCLALDLVVAWRIEHLKRLARQHPDAPATLVFDEHECRVLAAYANEHGQVIRAEDMSMQQATCLTGWLGGHQGRKSDGPPGSITLWRGMQRLQAMTLGWRLAHGEITREEVLRAFAEWDHLDTS